MIFKSICIAFSMYSQIPVPSFEWKDKEMKYAISFFPLVGVVIGIVLYGWILLDHHLEYSNVFEKTMMAVIIPLIITGGIHLDGFLDTSDALSSWQDAKQKLNILKDPHIGAFAVIRFCVLAGLLLASLSVFSLRAYQLYCFCFVLSRILSAYGVMHLKSAKHKGTLYAFQDASRKDFRINHGILLLEVFLCVGCMISISWLDTLCLLSCAVGIWMYYRHMAYKRFGGITGDTAGWFVCICEVAMAVVLAFLSRL